MRLSPKLLFLSELARDAVSIGAVCSSSSRLATGVARHGAGGVDGIVVELGGGTGAITEALLQQGVAASALVVVEKSARMAAYLAGRFPAVRIIHGDAAHLGRLLQDERPVRALVSCLPLRSLPGEAVADIIDSSLAVLHAQGRLVQFTYAVGARSPWTGAGLTRVATEMVWGNVPPARIDVFARAGAARMLAVAPPLRQA